MKTVILAWFFFMSSLLMAQPKVDRFQFDRLGDAGEYFALEEGAVDPGPAGKDVTWDFSHLLRRPIVDYSIRYIEPKDAPHSADYPRADLVLHFKRRSRDQYFYLQSREKRLYLLGNEDALSGSSIRYRDVSFFPNLDLAYGQTNHARIDGESLQSSIGAPIGLRIQGETSVSYDGYGTLLLPNGQTHTNVIRVKTIKSWSEANSISAKRFIEEIRYQYFEPGHSAYLFEIRETIFRAEEQGVLRNIGIVKLNSYRVAKESHPARIAKRGVHLTPNTSLFQSQILIHNPTEMDQSLQLTGVSASGLPQLEAQLDLTPGGTFRQESHQTLGFNAASFFASGCRDCVLSIDYRSLNEFGSAAQAHQSQDYRREFMFYPGEWDQLSDGQAIINVSNDPITIKTTQFDFNGNILKEVTLEEALPPGGKHLSLLNDTFIPERDSIIRIESEGLMSMMALRISNDNRFLYQNVPLPEGVDGTLNRWLPHFTSDTSGFLTEILVQNQSDDRNQLLFQPYNTEGRPQIPKLITLQAGETRRYDKHELFEDNTSHASFVGSSDCLASLVFRADSPDASSAVIHETTTLEQVFRIYPGDGSVLSDGLVLLNNGRRPATIHLLQIADNGDVLNQVVLDEKLAPYHKFVGLLEDFQPAVPQTHWRVESTQPLVVLSLRISKDRRYLFSNEILKK